MVPGAGDHSPAGALSAGRRNRPLPILREQAGPDTMSNLSRSLNDLIGRPAAQPLLGSHLETAYLAACAKPLSELTIEELRLLIGQRESLDVVVPLALDYLERDPLFSGELFEGDLLATVLRRPAMEFWAARPDHFRRVLRVIESVAGLQLDRELQRDIASFGERQRR